MFDLDFFLTLLVPFPLSLLVDVVDASEMLVESLRLSSLKCTINLYHCLSTFSNKTQKFIISNGNGKI